VEFPEVLVSFGPEPLTDFRSCRFATAATPRISAVSPMGTTNERVSGARSRTSTAMVARTADHPARDTS
jgi:hypothetical protein